MKHRVSRQRQIVVGVVLLLAGALVIHEECSKPRVKNAADLVVLNGPIDFYSFYDGSRGHHHYVIHLMQYPAEFQIPAGFVGCFDKDRFQSDLKRGDSLWIAIPKRSEDALASAKRIFIFSARSQTTTYLNEQDAIAAYNSNLPLVMGILLFLSGLGFIAWRPLYTCFS